MILKLQLQGGSPSDNTWITAQDKCLTSKSLQSYLSRRVSKTTSNLLGGFLLLAHFYLGLIIDCVTYHKYLRGRSFGNFVLFLERIYFCFLVGDFVYFKGRSHLNIWRRRRRVKQTPFSVEKSPTADGSLKLAKARAVPEYSTSSASCLKSDQTKSFTRL